MSARYSNSPTLSLTKHRSRLRACLFWAFSVCCIANLLLLQGQGHSLVACLLALVVAIMLYNVRDEAHCNVTLSWSNGIWTLHYCDCEQPIQPLARSVAMNWLVYFSYRELQSGKRGGIWLFKDSATPDQLRQLRMRLTLEESHD